MSEDHGFHAMAEKALMAAQAHDQLIERFGAADLAAQCAGDMIPKETVRLWIRYILGLSLHPEAVPK